MYDRLPFYGSAAFAVIGLIKSVFFPRGYGVNLIEVLTSVGAGLFVGYIGTVVLMMIVVAAMIPLLAIWNLAKSLFKLNFRHR